MKVPPKRKGNDSANHDTAAPVMTPSMKVPPKRKGNPAGVFWFYGRPPPLNESPSEKEGKLGFSPSPHLLTILPQ